MQPMNTKHPLSGIRQYKVMVWFRTESTYRDKGGMATEEAALAEARFFRSDSRGVKVIRPDGSEIIVKSESGV